MTARYLGENQTPPPRFAAGIAMIEYGLALSINHSCLDHKKIDITEFLVLYVFTILWLLFLFVKMQRLFFKEQMMPFDPRSPVKFNHLPRHQILLSITCQKGCVVI